MIGRKAYCIYLFVLWAEQLEFSFVNKCLE